MLGRRLGICTLLAVALVVGAPREPSAVDFPCDAGAAMIVALPQLTALDSPPLILDVSPAGDAILGQDELGQYIVWLAEEDFGIPHPFEPIEGFQAVAISNGGEYVAGRLFMLPNGFAPLRYDREAGTFDALDGFDPSLQVLEISGDGAHLLGSIQGDEGCSGPSPTGRIASYARVWGPSGAILSAGAGAASALLSAIDEIHNPGDRFYANPDSVSGIIPKWLSEDGSIVVGAATDSVGADLIDPTFREDQQVVEECKSLGDSAEAMRAVGGGVARLGAPISDIHPCATRVGGTIPLVGTLALAFATAASQDGSVSVGFASDHCSCNTSFCSLNSPWAYYSSGSGFQRIWTVIPSGAVRLNDRIFTSHDGRIVVGMGNQVDFGAGLSPLVWDRQKGRRRLVDWLEDDVGVDLGSWSLTSVDDFELGDGGVVVGQGFRIGTGVVAYAVRIPCLDSDADGLCNHWEDMDGIDVDGDGEITSADVSLPFADAMHKDLYVEVDSLFLSDLQNGALDDVEQAFADVPNSLVANPDGQPGIALHLLRDEDDILLPGAGFAYTGSGTGMPNELVFLRTNHFGSPFQRSNAPDAIDAQSRIYRYMVFGGTHYLGISGEAEPWGNDFIVTLDGYSGGTDGSRDFQAGTIMHELGHTLGLEHGGRGNANPYLPNYKSVMSYIWQLRGNKLVSDTAGQKAFHDSWVLDYSRRAYNFLSESALNESMGVGGDDPSRVMLVGPLRGCSSTFDCARVVTEKGAVNWNEDRDTLDGPPGIQTINIDQVVDNGRSGAGMLHRGHDDWTFVAENFCTAYRKSNWDPANVGPSSSNEDFSSTALGELDMEEAELILSQPLAIDCDLDGVDDQQQLDAGTAVDEDDDGLLDHCEPLRGDVDEDDDVDDADRDLLVAAFGLAEGETGYQALADLDRDRRVTLVDYQLWIEALEDFEAGLATSAAPAGSPPAACGLVGLELLVPAVLVIGRRRAKAHRRRTGRAGPC